MSGYVLDILEDLEIMLGEVTLPLYDRTRRYVTASDTLTKILNWLEVNG